MSLLEFYAIAVSKEDILGQVKKQTIKQMFLVRICIKRTTANSPFPSSPGPLFQDEGRCPAFVTPDID